MKDNFPPDALVIKFKPLGKPRAKYRVWSKGESFYWAALGANGKEDSFEAAARAAREYILLGINGLKSHGEYHGVLNASRL